MRGKGWGGSWDTRLALTRFTRMAPLSSLAMEVPFRNAELGVEPVGRGAGMKCSKALQGQGGNLASQFLFLLGAVTCAQAGAGAIKPGPRTQHALVTQQGPVELSKSQRHSESVTSSLPPAKCVLMG